MIFDEHPKRSLEIKADDSRAKIMRCIELWYAREGHAPTIREVASHVDLAFDTVRGHIDVLIREGYLIRIANVKRATGRNLRLTSKRYFF